MSRVGWASRPPCSASRGTHRTSTLRDVRRVSRGRRDTAGETPTLPDARRSLRCVSGEFGEMVSLPDNSFAARDIATLKAAPMSTALNPMRTVAELKELRALTGDENGAQRVAFTPTWANARPRRAGMLSWGKAARKRAGRKTRALRPIRIRRIYCRRQLGSNCRKENSA